jgi:hypothetical protein
MLLTVVHLLSTCSQSLHLFASNRAVFSQHIIDQTSFDFHFHQRDQLCFVQTTAESFQNLALAEGSQGRIVQADMDPGVTGKVNLSDVVADLRATCHCDIQGWGEN